MEYFANPVVFLLVRNTLKLVFIPPGHSTETCMFCGAHSKRSALENDNDMDNKVLATVNGAEITENDVNMTISKFPQDRQSYLSTNEGKKQLLQQIISFELMYNYAIDNGLQMEPQYLDQL